MRQIYGKTIQQLNTIKAVFDANLNKDNTNNGLHNLLPGSFHFISPGAYSSYSGFLTKHHSHYHPPKGLNWLPVPLTNAPSCPMCHQCPVSASVLIGHASSSRNHTLHHSSFQITVSFNIAKVGAYYWIKTTIKSINAFFLKDLSSHLYASTKT